MRDVNRVLLLGRLGCDPIVRKTKNGTTVANFSLATEIYLKTKYESETTWHRVVVWGRPAEKCEEQLKKGMAVFIEGKFKTRKYEDANGEANFMHEVHTDRITFLQSKMTYNASTLEVESEPNNTHFNENTLAVN